MRLSPSGRSVHPCCRADEGATSAAAPDAAPSGEDGGVGWAAPPSSPLLPSSTWETTLVEVPTLLIPTRNRSAAPRLWPAATSRMPTRAEVQFVVILRGSDLGKNRVLPLASALAAHRRKWQLLRRHVFRLFLSLFIGGVAAARRPDLAAGPPPTRCLTYNIAVQEQNAPALRGPVQHLFSAAAFLIPAFGNNL